MGFFSKILDPFGAKDALLGSAGERITQPTAFGTLPQFGKDAFQQAIERGTALSEDPSLFAPAGLTDEQRSALSTLSSGLDPTSPEAFNAGLSTFGDPFEEQVIQNAIRDINETGAGQLSDVGSFADAAGGFGGTRHALLESEVLRNTQRNIGNVSGQLRSQGFQTAADRTLADLGRTQNVAGNLFQLSDLDRQVQTQQQQAPLEAVNYLAQLAQRLPTGGGGVSIGPETKGLLGSGGGIDPSIIAAGATALSDERLKEDIVFKGKENGHNIYEFQYIWSPIRYIGVMAQEVLQKMPQAVAFIDNYMCVDYDKINVKMRQVNV